MDLHALKITAREKFQGCCRVCPVCDGVVCAGEVPGMGGTGTGAAFKHNVQALACYQLNMRTIHQAAVPVLSRKLLGMDLAVPVLAAPIGGIALNMKGAMAEDEYCEAIVAGCRQAGVVAMTGDGPNPVVFEAGMKVLASHKGYGIPTIKPRATDVIIEMARQAATAGAPAFAVDIDAAALINMTNAGQPVGPKSVSDLAEIKKNTPIPFIVKGIMTPDEAELCVEAGVDAIVVTNHGGRSLDHTPGTAEVLPAISEAVQGKLVVLVDGGVRGGVDILKMLALGADAVLIGRPLAIAAVGGGSAGVAFMINKWAAELRTAMIMTGTVDVADVSGDIIW